MKELENLCARLAKTRENEPVRLALEAVLLSPDALDLQINALGLAHQANWLPNRKRVLWQAFAVGGEPWADRCVTRILAPGGDASAVCALLNAPALVALKRIRACSPDLVAVWDVNGAPSCGLGLARHGADRFDHYFYVGWEPGQETVQRLEYIPSIQPPPGQEAQPLHRINGPCRVTGGCWAELPYAFGYWTGYRDFAGSASTGDLEPHGFTASLRRQLGYDGGTGAV